SEGDIDPTLPELRAIILDFTGVSHVDITSIQNLVDVRKQLDRHANQSVLWHFAGVQSPWIRRALIAGGFGSSESATRTVLSVANVAVLQDNDTPVQHPARLDEEISAGEKKLQTAQNFDSIPVPILSVSHPYFHVDLDEALKAAELELGVKQN
ncbi:hypothetical protein GGI12_005777, partial [Dipsacomyces acuminosporus]